MIGAFAAVAITVAGGGAVAHADDSLPAQSVEWVLIGSESFGDAVHRASATQDPAGVRAALEEFANIAGYGDVVDFPGLSGLSSADAEELLTETASALAANAPLPAEALALPLDATLAADPLPPAGEIINNGATYRQWNWAQRGVTTGTGSVHWTDRVELRWQTNPGAVTSNVSYNTSYSLSSGFFSNLRVRTRAFTNSTPVADTMWRPSNPGYVVRPIDNSEELYGMPIHHVTELAVTGSNGVVYSDQQSTAVAICDTDWGQCFYS